MSPPLHDGNVFLEKIVLSWLYHSHEAPLRLDIYLTTSFCYDDSMEPSHFEALYPALSRFDVMQKIFTFVKEGNSCELIGLPGVGRANILGLLAYNRAVREAHVGDNQKWFHFVTVDFSEVRGKPFFETTKLMFLELVDSLRERKLLEEYETTSAIFKDALSFQDELVLFQGLKKTIDYLAIEKELTIIFLFERFEEYLPMLTKSFFSNLRILRNRAKYRFSAVFSLGRPLEELIEPTMLADFYEFVVGHHIFVPLPDEPVATFRLSYLEKITGKNISQTDYTQILELTAGHGKLTRLALEAIVTTIEKPSAAFFLSKKSIQGALLEIWHYLTPQEQQEVQTQQLDTFLEHVGLIDTNGITIPLFKAFLLERPQQQEKFMFDVTTNTIKRGTQNISDTLTSSEFRLFALLLQHEHEVVERDAIIQTVWKDTATTAGVTDQAIDQLVFRLRKKIEQDPNNPQYLQTIKGRGIKFTQ